MIWPCWRAVDFRDATLVVLVNERSRDARVTLQTGGGTLGVRVPAGDAWMPLVDLGGRVLDGTHRPERRGGS